MSEGAVSVSCGDTCTGDGVAGVHSASRIAFIASLRWAWSIRSMNKMPSRRSVSCWMQRASSSVPSIVTGSPYMLEALGDDPVRALDEVGVDLGKDRQPSSPSSSSLERGRAQGLIKAARLIVVHVIGKHPHPTRPQHSFTQPMSKPPSGRLL